MIESNRLELGISSGGNPGKTLLVKGTSAVDFSTLRDVFQYNADPVNGDVLMFTTLDSAVGAMRANIGDKVKIAPGHTETLSAAAAIALDVVGITVEGLGSGAARPTLTFGTSTAASLTISAASVKLKNIIGVSAIDGLLNPFNITGDDVEIDVEWQDASSTVEATRAILATGADRLKANLVYRGFTAGNAVVNGIRLVGCAGADIYIDAYGVNTTAWVEMLTTASTNVKVKGVMYTSGISDLTRDVVDTVGGSTWSANIFDASFGGMVIGGSAAALASDDVSGIAATLAVPAPDATTNANERDVVGNKTDAAVTAVGTTKSIVSYVKGLISMATVAGADATANAFAADVVGNKTDAGVQAVTTNKSLMGYVKGLLDIVAGSAGIASFPASAAPANAVSLAEVIREMYDQEPKSVNTVAAVMVDATTVFTITGGPIRIEELYAYCVTTNDATASTLQYSSTPTLGSVKTITAASASLANAAAGASVRLNPTSLATAPDLVADTSGGVAIGADVGNKIIVNAGTITTVIGVGSTTGTWTHHLRYTPMSRGVVVS